ncbi:hypothetical protein [Kordiimonas sp.]|uniref:hypothetical protein n=1 Tax=Kordiimonas sp. TaxID=1970157 RepID=UPI003A95479D
MQRLPILDIVKQSFALPFSRPVEFFKTIGLFISVTVLAIIAAMIVGMASGLSPEAMASLEESVANGDFSALAAMIPALLVVVVLVMMVAAYIFNFWVRAGAFGFEHARIKPLGAALSAAFVNGLKFVLIAILLGIVSFVIISILSTLGLTSSFSEQIASSMDQDLAAATRAGILNQIVSLVAGSIIYSLFSANLTQTAMRTDDEGLSHPHTVDFAVVLILVYLVLLVPVTLAGLTGSAVLSTVINLVLGVFVMFAIGVAHGIRYRICRAEEVGVDTGNTSNE